MYIDEDFAINCIESKKLSPLLTGKLHRGVTEIVCLKEYVQAMIIPFNGCVLLNPVVCIPKVYRAYAEYTLSMSFVITEAGISHEVYFVSFAHASKQISR